MEDETMHGGAEAAGGPAPEVPQRMVADLWEFMNAFPEAAKDPQSIPAEVWEQVRSGRPMVSAYAVHSVAQAREEARRSSAGPERSTGSMRSAGGSAALKDAFLQGFLG